MTAPEDEPLDDPYENEEDVVELDIDGEENE